MIVLSALAVNISLLTAFVGLPALALAVLRRRLSTSTSLIPASLLCVALYLLLGQLAQSLHLPGSPTSLLLSLPLCAFAAAHLAPRDTLRDPLLLPLLLLAFLVRILPPLADAALGQSDAYSHLQFLRDMSATGVLRHPYYPSGHARVCAVAVWLTRLDPYLVARFGGATFGIGLVAGLHTLALRLYGRPAARVAALLAAGCPLALPLLRTGVGLFANQLGLLLLPALLLALLERRILSSFLLAAGLLLGTPMMLLDLLPGLCLALLLLLPFRRALPLLLLLGTAVLATGFLFLSRLAPESREALVFMLTRSPPGSHNIPALLLSLLRDYLQPVPTGAALPLRLATGIFALLSALSVLPLRRENPLLAALCLLTALAGLQASTGILQFSAYARAGWFFLALACLLGGILYAHLRPRLPFPRLADAALLLLCLVSLIHPPRHTPHLSPAENALLTRLWELRRHPPATLTHLHTRAFTRFDGAQGDPVPAMLADLPSFRLHRLLPNDPSPTPQPGFNLILLDDLLPPTPTGNPDFDREVALLLAQNQRLREAFALVPDATPASPLHGLTEISFPSPP